MVKTEKKGATQGDRAEDPGWVQRHGLELDYDYYFNNKFMNPICDLLEPLVENPKEAIFGDLILKTSVSRFARTLGTLLGSGVPVLRAMEIVADTAGNKVISDAVVRARSSVKEGEKISSPLYASRIFPVMVTQMIAVGEETGRLDQMLAKVADFYDSEVESTLKGLTSLIEPLMIVGLGAIVGFIAVSVISPIYQLVGSIK